MSEDIEPGEENENDEFEFYFAFTKPMVLDLPSSEEKAIAAAWVQKLESDKDDKERLNYLKLLLFILQRGRLSGIFKQQPPSGPFEPFPPGFSIIDMGNLMLDQDDGQMYGGGDTRAVPYNVEISNDLREFVASQEVPNFGIQMYYAWSADDPLPKWAHFDEEKFPKFILDKIKQLNEDGSKEKSETTFGKKKVFDIGQGEKSLKNRVKSPQEIENIQGRTFHTYMGLIGRMGNYNKCEDDDEKGFQAADRKGASQRKKMQRRSPTGEAENMGGGNDCENTPTGASGGLTSANRPCLCPYPCHHQECPDFRKGGTQSSDAQPSGACPAQQGYAQRGRQVRQVSPKRNMRDQTPEVEPITSQQRCETTTMRTPESPMSCMTGQGGQRGSANNVGTCLCSTAQCICPCPRGPGSKTPSCGQGPRDAASATRTFVKPPQQDPRCNNQNTPRSGEFLTSFKAPDNYMDRQTTPTNTPMGGRSCGPSAKSLRPVSHCYDERNPDPCLTEVINRQPTAPSPYCDTQQPPPQEASFKARRQLFKPLAESTAIQRRAPQQSGMPCPTMDPGFMPLSECESDSPRSDEFFSYIQEDDELNEGYCAQYSGGVNGNYKTASQNASAASQGNRSLFAVPEGGGRLANIANVLQGLQQKTEAHREKCASGAVRKSPNNAGICPPQVTPNNCPPSGNQIGCDAGRNQTQSPQARPDPNVYFTPQLPPREQVNFREVQSAPTKTDESCMFMSNQIGYQGPSPDSQIKYFPTSTPPLPRSNLRFENYQQEEDYSENECGYEEENFAGDCSPESYMDDQYLKTQSAPCPQTESFFYSPPTTRQRPGDVSQYTPPQGQSVKFQGSAMPRSQSPRGTTSQRRSSNGGICRPSPQQQGPPQQQCPPQQQGPPQQQCPPQQQGPPQQQCPPQQQSLPQQQCPPQQQGPPQQQCPPQQQSPPQQQCPPPSPQRQVQIQCTPPSPRRQSPAQSPLYSQQCPDNWSGGNYLTPQYQPPDRGNLRPQAVSTGGKYQSQANINCPRPQAQPDCQRISFEQSTNNSQDFNSYEDECDYQNMCSSSLFVEMDSYMDNDPDMGNPC